MSLINAYAQELERESHTTRKMLERVPIEKFDWQPHPKSMKLGHLASHIAELPSWIGMALNTSELDFAANPYAVPPIHSINYHNHGRCVTVLIFIAPSPKVP